MRDQFYYTKQKCLEKFGINKNIYLLKSQVAEFYLALTTETILHPCLLKSLIPEDLKKERPIQYTIHSKYRIVFMKFVIQ